MIRIIKEGRIAHHEEFSLDFKGYSFPCNYKGELLPLSPEAQRNFDKQTTAPQFVERYWTEYEHPIAECYCGAEIELRPDHEGLCYCYCGKCYNSAGQSIRPRSEWEENY